jgi:tRNA-specific 2-thiouridylase
MSGGVDSSVVAALTKEAGFDVVGITMQLYDHGLATGRKSTCCAGRDIHDARTVAAALDIPHYVLDYEKRFAKDVIGAFAESYMAGETPLPCALCNEKIKFGPLLATARELGAEALVTGHYTSRLERPEGAILRRPHDAARDQSYFLFGVRAQELAHLRFPLGDLPKAEVRRKAAALGLPVAEKPDSQDLCFVPSGRYTDVITRLHPLAVEPGDIVHVDGRTLGRHSGITRFTIGQRHGLGIASAEPLYVIKLDPARREVLVGPRERLRVTTIALRNVNWLGDQHLDQLPGNQLDICVRVRSTQPPQRATLKVKQDCVTVALHDDEGAVRGGGVAPGQACVFYADGSASSRLLGGGWITGALRTDDMTNSAGAGRSAAATAS